MKIERKNIVVAISALSLGLLIGWAFLGSSRKNAVDEHNHAMETTESSHVEIWTCSMHPQIRQNEPGECPICGMDLIPLDNKEQGDMDPMAISMSPTAMELASVSTAIVGRMNPVKTLRLSGKVQADERLVYSQSSHIPGRIEKLMLNFTGEYVKKGDVIASVYAPDLRTAQEELLEAQKIKDSQPELFNAAVEKLKNWKLSDKQIELILQSGKIKENFSIEADISGFVTKKKVNTGDYIGKGEAIYEITDLSRVWILFDVYEADIPWIKKTDKIAFSVASLPGESFEERISYVDPVINPATRVARARVEFLNSGVKLKPEMFVSGIVQATIAGTGESIVVPKTAVMWTGKRSVVYVKTATDQGVSFRMREVMLGPSLGDSFIIESGLEDGEEIAVNGTFSIDAAAQLAGKPSMMSPSGGPVMTAHNHSGMNMEESSDAAKSMEAAGKPSKIPAEFKKQLTGVYESYLLMKDAFVASDPALASKKAAGLETALKNTNMKLLKGEDHIAWMEQMEILKDQVAVIQKSDNIETQRKAFSIYNLTFYKTLKTFGLAEEKVYYQYCPMANNDTGAYWFSDTEEIRNPYFGNAMLSCGETRETLEY